jgi:predicted GIY-YIG superfamily endonuclease
MEKLYTVYKLTNERESEKRSYIGYTSDFKMRIHNHKSKGRDVSAVEVLLETSSKEEALSLEREYHLKNHSGYKRKTILPLYINNSYEYNRIINGYQRRLAAFKDLTTAIMFKDLFEAKYPEFSTDGNYEELKEFAKKIKKSLQ